MAPPYSIKIRGKEQVPGAQSAPNFSQVEPISEAQQCGLVQARRKFYQGPGT
jgi:hypothetical protein